MSTPPKTPTRVSPETISKAVTSLLQWNQTKSTQQKPQLLPQEQFFYLVLTLNNIPQKSTRTNPYKIPLPHPLIQDSQICLIIDDRPKSKLTKKAAKNKVQADNVSVAKVLKFTKLRSEYKSYDDKRKLCESFDMFFSDKGVVTYLPKMLGKVFFKKKKLPLPVNLSHNNWKEQIERGRCSGLLRMNTGTCSVVKVGRVSMKVEEIVENVVEGINGVVGFVPEMWEGVRSLHLRLLDSMALPLYQSVPDVAVKIDGVKEVGEVKKKDGKSGKKEKGRIREVNYMDGSGVGGDELGSDVDEGENESEKKNGASELVGKKRKKGGLAKERVISEEGLEELGKKTEKVSKRVRIDVTIDNENEDSGKEDPASEEVGTKKKKKKGDAKKGLVTSSENVEKPAKKTKKKGDDEEEEKAHLPVESADERGRKKGKKKSSLGTTEKVRFSKK